jgi:hypothetical protein
MLLTKWAHAAILALQHMSSFYHVVEQHCNTALLSIQAMAAAAWSEPIITPFATQLLLLNIEQADQ